MKNLIFTLLSLLMLGQTTLIAQGDVANGEQYNELAIRAEIQTLNEVTSQTEVVDLGIRFYFENTSASDLAQMENIYFEFWVGYTTYGNYSFNGGIAISDQNTPYDIGFIDPESSSCGLSEFYINISDPLNLVEYDAATGEYYLELQLNEGNDRFVVLVDIFPDPSPDPEPNCYNITLDFCSGNSENNYMSQGEQYVIPTLIGDEINTCPTTPPGTAPGNQIGDRNNQNEGQNNKEATLYPNPCSSILHIASEYHQYSIEIFNSQGKQVLAKSTVSNEGINISYLSSGLYFIKLENKGLTIIEALSIID